ncbi:MAG: class I SAM-dependent methyltransferase [Sphingomonas fennica]
MRIHNGLRAWIVNTVSPRARAARMARFVAQAGLKPGMRVIDLGGLPAFWRFCPVPLDVTIVNTDVAQIRRRDFPPHRFTIHEGDATALPFADHAFDLAFSNSTIEHVGGPAERAAFAHEVRRLAPSYYVQTPSIAFPYEVHTGLPFWWHYPPALRARIIARWRRTNPVLAEFAAGTTVVRRAEMAALFPDAVIERERLLGFTKSLILWRRAAG